MRCCDECPADAIPVVNRLSKPIEIELQNVTRFSYGELTDGEFAIWAEGKAGWFEIHPAPRYSEIYEGMVEAVQLLYFVTDIYNEPRKRGGGPSPQLIFQEVSASGRGDEGNPDVLTCFSMPKMSGLHAPTPPLQQRYSADTMSF
jgi:hypothetical protein